MRHTFVCTANTHAEAHASPHSDTHYAAKDAATVAAVASHQMCQSHFEIKSIDSIAVPIGPKTQTPTTRIAVSAAEEHPSSEVRNYDHHRLASTKLNLLIRAHTLTRF